MESKKLKHIISAKQFSINWLEQEFFPLVKEIENIIKEGKEINFLKGKKMASLFYEPSTRTRASFEIAMATVGGRVVFSSENAKQFSSAAKGETIEDTIKVINGYLVDIIVLRHFDNNAAELASNVSLAPIINAGGGFGEHPTQALLDIFTIKNEIGRINNFEIAIVGDLFYGRTVHSLLYFLGLYKNVKIYLVSPKELRLPQKYKKILVEKGIEFEENENLNEKILKNADILYITRVQKERFASKEKYERVKDFYVVDKETLGPMKKSARVMHPLPRINEISKKIDNDPRAAYFRQAQNGLYVRMALLKMILS